MNTRPLAFALLLAACAAPVDASSGDGPTASAATEIDATPRGPWGRTYVGDVEIDGITSDPNGRVLTGGYFVGKATFDGVTLESVRGADGAPTKDVFVAKHRRDGSLAWIKQYGGPGLEGNVYDLASDARSWTYASGAFSGRVDFGGTVLTSTVEGGSGSASSGTYGNMFLLALGAAGETKWVLQGKGTRVSGGNEVAIGPTGEVLQVGMFGGGKEAGGSMELGDHTVGFEGGFFDTYVTKVSPGGDVAWVAHVGGDGAQRGKAIAADPSGNVLVAGDAWDGTTRFAIGRKFDSSGRGQDFWVAKYSPEGTLLWFQSFGGSGVNEVKGIGSDASGNVIVSASFDGEALTVVDRSVRSSGDANTGVVFSLTPDGKHTRWTNTIAYVSKCCELEVDANGHTFLGAAAIGPTVTFQRGAPFTLGGTPRGGLLAEIDGAGALASARTAVGSAVEFGELSLLGGGYVAVAASFEGASLTAGSIRLTGPGPRTQAVLVLPP